MTPPEETFLFRCDGADLVGVLHPAAGASRLGVVIVVGGPQYRVGSHRQFVTVARAIARSGHPALRFDYRGMGDSEGDFAGFESIAEDIRAAVDALMARAPTVEQVVLWGLCDAASAILLYGPSDARVVGQVLINPWVRTPEGLARTHLRHYYVGRLLSASFWRKLSTGALDVRATLGSLVGSIRLATGMPATGRRGPRSLPERMADGLRRFRGASLLILCGADLTAREFEDRSRDVAWQGLIDGDRVTMFRLPAADHTFSRAEWREAVIERTNAWLARSVGAEVSGR